MEARNSSDIILLMKSSVVSRTPKLISDSVQFYVELILYHIVSGIIAVFGIVANVISAVVFVKQGIQESSSLTLLCLTISDLGICVFTVLFTVGIAAIKVLGLNLSVSIYDLMVVSCSIPRTYFSEISLLIMVVLSLERCCCVMKPFTFKRIINKRSTTIVLIIILLQATCFTGALISTNTLAWEFNMFINKTQLRLSQKKNDWGDLEWIVDYKAIVFTNSSVIIIVLSSCVMSCGLTASGKFKRKAAATVPSDPNANVNKDVANKEIRLTKIVLLMSVILFTTFMPIMGMMIAGSLVSELTYFGRYRNLHETLWAIVYVATTTNAAINIIVYYFISLKFRQTFCAIFSKMKVAT